MPLWKIGRGIARRRGVMIGARLLLLCATAGTRGSLSTTIAKFGTLPSCVHDASSRVIVVSIDTSKDSSAPICPDTLNLSRKIGAREIFRLKIPFGDARISTVLESGQLQSQYIFDKISSCLVEFHSPVRLQHRQQRRKRSESSLDSFKLSGDLAAGHEFHNQAAAN